MATILVYLGVLTKKTKQKTKECDRSWLSQAGNRRDALKLSKVRLTTLMQKEEAGSDGGGAGSDARGLNRAAKTSGEGNGSGKPTHRRPSRCDWCRSDNGRCVK